MSFNQTRDILDHAREFHRRLIRFYSDLKHLTEDELTLKLVEDLVDHERQLEARLSDYEESVSDNTLDTFFKYMTATTDQSFANYPVPDEIDIDYVIQTTRFFDEKLERFYESMAKKAISVQVREMLENLQHLEQQEQLALSKLMVSLQEV
jgi:rubrerythrin